jgi:hypothetical protein
MREDVLRKETSIAQEKMITSTTMIETWLKLDKPCECHDWDFQGFSRLSDVLRPCESLRLLFLEKEMDQTEKEIESLRYKAAAAEKDLKAAVFMSKVNGSSASRREGVIASDETTGPLTDLLSIDRAVFLVEKGKRLVKDMNASEKRELRRKMDIAEKQIRCLKHGIHLSIIEDMERATSEERENLRALDKKYEAKPSSKVSKESHGKNAFEGLVKALIAAGMSESKAKEQATNTVILGRMDKGKM